MRGLLKFIGFIAFLVGLYYARDAFIRSDINAQALAFVKSTVEGATMRWNRAVIDKQADPTLAQQVENAVAIGNTHVMDFAFYAKLGERVGEVNCTLGDYTTFKDETQNFISANYTCNTQFEKGAASVLLSILRNKETAPWSIAYFDVSAPYLSSLTAQEKH